MEVIFIIFTGAFIGALLLAAFYLGYQEGLKKKPEEPAFEVNDKNKKAVKDMASWLGYKGGKE